MMSNNAKDFDDEDLLDEQEDAIARSELRWEKGVEFALARELQMWHVVSQVNDTQKQWANNGYEPCAKEILDLVEKHGREPRYLPMDGKAERTLGDALGATSIDKLLLIECKKSLDGSGWEREALEEVRTVDEGGKASISNRGGKGRKATLEEIEAIALDLPNGMASMESIKSLGAKCHVLVGEDSTTAPFDLSFASYWDYIFKLDGMDADGVLARHPIKALQNQGLEFERFRSYVYALLLADMERTSSGDSAWIARELILLAYGTNLDTRVKGWIGGRILSSRLMKILQLDEEFHDLMAWVVSRENADEAMRKQKEKNQRIQAQETKTASKGGAKKNKKT